MPDTPCELCGDPTPERLVRRDPERGWDALCPACWMLNLPPAGEDVVLCTPETQVRLWSEADAQRFYNAELSAMAETCQLAPASPFAEQQADTAGLGFFRLEGHTPVPEPDLSAFARWLATTSPRVAWTGVAPGIEVSDTSGNPLDLSMGRLRPAPRPWWRGCRRRWGRLLRRRHERPPLVGDPGCESRVVGRLPGLGLVQDGHRAPPGLSPLENGG